MAQSQHNDDLRNVRERDTVEIVTSDGEVFEAECTDFQVQHADARSGEVRETRVWLFDAVEYQPSVSIIDGLKSSPDDPDFPIHNEIWDRQQEGTMGYINEVTIFGEMEA